MVEPHQYHDDLRPGWLETPHPSRFGPHCDGYDEAMAAHDRAVKAERPGYVDPVSGLYVMTAADLGQRGWCCDRGCRHCPWIT